MWVKTLQGDPAQVWDTWAEIRRCNPLANIDAGFRKQVAIGAGRGARRPPSAGKRFASYRLNIPTGDESTRLLTPEDLDRVIARPVPEREGRPVVGRGHGRKPGMVCGNGNVGQRADRGGRRLRLVSPASLTKSGGIRVPQGTYQRLADSGRLVVADGYRVPPASMLADLIRSEWGTPVKTMLDRFRMYQLEDCARGLKLEARVTRYSESSADIRALRRSLPKTGH